MKNLIMATIVAILVYYSLTIIDSIYVALILGALVGIYSFYSEYVIGKRENGK